MSPRRPSLRSDLVRTGFAEVEPAGEHVQALARMIRMLREKGFTVVMVEQNFRFAAPLADRFYVMEHGRIVEGFAAGELQAKMGMLHEYLGV